MSDRSETIAKIKRLRELRVDRGCTEAEAASAAEKVAQLMREAQLSEADLEITERRTRAKFAARGAAHGLAPVIAYCTNCTSMLLKDHEMVFIGRDPGPEIARYLLDVCETAVRVELDRFKARAWYKARRKLATRRQASADFVEGLVIRLSHRLLELFEDTVSDRDREASKDALVERYGQGVPVEKRQREERFSTAANAGWIAGGEVGLHHGVKTGRRGVEKIGGAS